MRVPPPMLRPEFEKAGARLYLGLWPLVVIDLPTADRATYEAIFTEVERRVFAKRQPYVIVTDTRRVSAIPTADVRKYMADWMKQHEKDNTSLGSATIVESSLVRGALTALYWLFEPPTPQYVAKDWRDAHAWALARFDAAQVPLRPSLREAIEQPY